MDHESFASLRQHQAGVFTRHQALELGMTRRQADLATSDRRWVRVAGKGFVVKGNPIGPEQGAWAAELTLPGAVIWGPSALKLWRPNAPLPASQSVLIASASHRWRLYRIDVKRVGLTEQEMGDRGGLKLQKQGAALVDSLAALDPKDADHLFAWALARDLMATTAFDQLVDHRANRRNVRRLRNYAHMLKAGAGSQAELRFQAILRKRGIGGWEANAKIRLRDGTTARADLLFRAQKLVGEVDGWGAHGSKRAFQTDRARQNSLVNDGYRVLRFTWEDITGRPDHCADQIARALAESR